MSLDDSDSAEVENVFVEDNGKHIDGFVDDAQKKVEVPLKKIRRKTGIWLGRKTESPIRNATFSFETKVHYFDRDDIEEVKRENAYCKKGSLQEFGGIATDTRISQISNNSSVIFSVMPSIDVVRHVVTYSQD
nr:hypothetical protein [Tanacetum cinerariifolium]